LMINDIIGLLGGGVTIAPPYLAIYGGSGQEAFNGVAYDSDGNLYLAGSTTSTGKIGSSDGIVVKLDPEGALLWAQTYGLATKTAIFYGIAISGTDVVVCGASNEPGYGNNDCVVLKLD